MANEPSDLSHKNVGSETLKALIIVGELANPHVPFAEGNEANDHPVGMNDTSADN